MPYFVMTLCSSWNIRPVPQSPVPQVRAPVLGANLGGVISGRGRAHRSEIFVSGRVFRRAVTQSELDPPAGGALSSQSASGGFINPYS
jgi:hypothetical protein